MGLTVVDIAGIQAQVDADIPPEVVHPQSSGEVSLSDRSNLLPS